MWLRSHLAQLLHRTLTGAGSIDPRPCDSRRVVLVRAARALHARSHLYHLQDPRSAPLRSVPPSASVSVFESRTQSLFAAPLRLCCCRQASRESQRPFSRSSFCRVLHHKRVLWVGVCPCGMCACPVSRGLGPRSRCVWRSAGRGVLCLWRLKLAGP